VFLRVMAAARGGAAAVIADDDTIVVIGSQAVLGQFPDAPEPMRVSEEAGLFPLHHPKRADLIEGSIGELSPFHQTFGYYAQGVAEETAVQQPRPPVPTNVVPHYRDIPGKCESARATPRSRARVGGRPAAKALIPPRLTPVWDEKGGAPSSPSASSRGG
jgi:hypothetical protein